MPYKDKERERERGRGRNRRARIEGQRIVKEAKNVPCMDCGGRFHFSAMDFDHVRGKKLFVIGTLKGIGTSIKRLLDEISKCDIVCSNCHRVRTFKQRFIEMSDGTLKFNPKWQRQKQELKTHCVHGHAFTKENTGFNSSNGRYCRICKREQSTKRNRKRAEQWKRWNERYSNGMLRSIPISKRKNRATAKH